MSSQDQLDDFILNSLKINDLSQYSFRVDVVPNILDQWRQNFRYAQTPNNPAFVDATLSPQDILVWSYTLQYNPNGILWRVDPAGRPHPDDYHKFLEQNRIIQKATERTIAEVQSNSSSGVNTKNAKQAESPEVQSMLARYRKSERVSAPSPADLKHSEDINTHTVKYKDVLWQIAEKYGVSIQEIVAANPQITNPDQIKEGWVLVIPHGSANNNTNVFAKLYKDTGHTVTDGGFNLPKSSEVTTVYVRVTSGFGSLTDEQKKANAQYIYNSLSLKGWTKEAICGLLGNIEQESGFNPGAWETSKTEDGYGLVQWTPAGDKFLKWANLKANQVNAMAENDPKKLMDLQLEYLLLNLKPGAGEWLPTTKYHSPYKMTADEYIHSKNDPGELAKVFHAHFERSADTEEIIKRRAGNAQKWYEFFSKS